MKNILCSILLLCFLSVSAQQQDELIEDYSDKSLKWGIRTVSGKIITPPKYSFLSPLFNKKINKEGLSYFYSADRKKYGFVDKTGKEVIPARYHRAYDFNDGWAKVMLNDSTDCFIDKSGNEYFLNTDYDTCANYFHEGLLPVKKNGKWGFINKKSKLVIPYQYNAVGQFHEGLAAVSMNGKGKHDPDISFYSNYVGKWGFIDVTGKLVIPMSFDSRKNFKNGVCVVGKYPEQGRKIEKYGVIDKTGSTIIPFVYAELDDAFADGLLKAAILKTPPFIEQSWGFINLKNEWVAQPIYDYVETFSEGIALVNMGSKGSISRAGGTWGFINTKGSLLFPMMSCARIVGSGLTFKTKGFAEVHLKDYSQNEADFYKINLKGEKIK